MSEFWKTTEGPYEVSNRGRVRNAKSGKLLRARRDADGYLLVTLWLPKKADRKVHRLVLAAFRGACTKDQPEADHINGKRDDNRLENLRWASRSVNRRNLHCPARGASGTRGVRYREGKPNPWQAYASVNGRFRSLGHFATKTGAAGARASFEREALRV